MGADISAHTGVAVAVNKLTAVVTAQNRQHAIRSLLRYTAELLQLLRSELDSIQADASHLDHERRVANLLITAFSLLNSQSTVTEIRAMLESMTQGVENRFDSYVRNSDEAIAVWEKLIGQLHPSAPLPESTVFIDNTRYQGADLPEREVLFVFPEEACFTRVKTKEGLALDEMLGIDTELATWTTYSV